MFHYSLHFSVCLFVRCRLSFNGFTLWAIITLDEDYPNANVFLALARTRHLRTYSITVLKTCKCKVNSKGKTIWRLNIRFATSLVALPNANWRDGRNVDVLYCLIMFLFLVVTLTSLTRQGCCRAVGVIMVVVLSVLLLFNDCSIE